MDATSQTNLLYTLILGIFLYEFLFVWSFLPVATFSRLFGKKRKLLKDGLPGISIIVPAFNEENTILDSIESLNALAYPNYEVIVVNDGSCDQTLTKLVSTLDAQPTLAKRTCSLSHTGVNQTFRSKLYPNILIIDKQKSGKGKADALNIGIGYSQKTLICTVDADSVLDKNALNHLVQPFLQDDKTIAAGGAVRAGNGSSLVELQNHRPKIMRSLLTTLQSLEYLKMSFVDRVALRYFNSIYIIAGAFGLFDRNAIIEVNGYSDKTLAEDIDLTLRLHQLFREKGQAYKITHVPEACCWTEVPYNLNLLYKQRARWQGGFVQAARDNFSHLFKNKMGPLGFFLIPFSIMTIFEPLVVCFNLFLLYSLFKNFALSEAFTALIIGQSLGATAGIIGLTIGQSHLQKKSILQSVITITSWIIFGRFYDTICLFFRTIGTYKGLRGTMTWGEMARSGFEKRRISLPSAATAASIVPRQTKKLSSATYN